MISFINNIKRFFTRTKNIELSTLPSMGLFYKDDMRISIKRASKSIIDQYTSNYNDESLIDIIDTIKYVVRTCTILNKEYNYYDIKGVDTIFIFLEIVKFTLNKEICIKDNDETIIFCSENFNYHKNSKFINKYYNSERKSVEYNGYSGTLPSIGIEKSLTDYMITNYTDEDGDKWLNYTYSFMYFLSDKNNITNDEFLNLIEIFNNEMSDKDKEDVKYIVDNLLPLTNYSLLDKYGNVVDLKSKINFKDIWIKH